MASLVLNLQGLEPREDVRTEVSTYSLEELQGQTDRWDQVVKASHLTNCWYQQACSFNLYVKDGIVLREEQAGNYPPPNDPEVPDFNPRGCQKGVCYAQRMYDPSRLKYPLKRVGARGEGKWQRLSWDQALGEIADTLIDILTTDGPDTIVQAGGTRTTQVGSDGLGITAFFDALGTPSANATADNGDDHQGAAVTFGKVVLGDSADNWYYADMILVWGGNPANSNIVHHHFIAEARYNGARVVAISPDYNASALHADLWVPVNVGTDAALALGMAQVILAHKLYNEAFVREQTDLPLLVREDNLKFLREADLKRGGREDVFYLHDLGRGVAVEAPRKSLSLNGLTPALEGSFEIETVRGKVRVKPVMQLLREKLDREYRPEQASRITGVAAEMIERLAREVAKAKSVVNIPTANFGKYYHGDLIERAMILVFALCGHMGRKGATYSAFPMLGLDTAVGGLERRGDQTLLMAAESDPRFAKWREDGYTDEMIVYEYVHQAFEAGSITPTSLFFYVHGGLLDLSQKHGSWDPHLKRPVDDYFKEAFAKKWQFLTPGPEKEPRAMFAFGGNFLRRARGTDELIRTLLPKLKLLVTIDWRMCSTGLYSDYVLPACSWYERDATFVMGMPQAPFVHINTKAAEPLYESKGEWEIFVRLAQQIAQRARERSIVTYKDRLGQDRRLDRIEEKVTFGGLYTEDDEESIARDAFVGASNAEALEWEDARNQGFARYTGIGKQMRSIGNACDVQPGEPFIPLTWHVEKKEPYPTLTRRIQFYIDHDWYLELGEALPTHKEPPKAGGNYLLQLTGGHARWSIHSDWSDDALMLQLQRGTPVIFLNPEDARARGIEDGTEVEVHNDVASFRITAAVSPAVRPGQAIVYHAWENFQFPGWRHYKGVQASPLNPIELAGGYFHIRPTVMNCYPGFSDRGTRVEVRKAQ